MNFGEHVIPLILAFFQEPLKFKAIPSLIFIQLPKLLQLIYLKLVVLLRYLVFVNLALHYLSLLKQTVLLVSLFQAPFHHLI